MKATFAVIFDLNGTLVDTEKLYHRAYDRVLQPYGVDFTIDHFTDFWTKRGLGLSDYLTANSRNDLLPLVPKLLAEKDSIFQDLLKTELTIMSGALKLLSDLKQNEVPVGLDSSTTRDNILIMLDGAGLSTAFSAIASGDMSLDETKYGNKKNKSARLKFLANQLGVLPDSTIVIGDADKDLRGAKEAGMKFIAVPNCYTIEQDLSAAELQVSSLVDLNYNMLCECFALRLEKL